MAFIAEVGAQYWLVMVRVGCAAKISMPNALVVVVVVVVVIERSRRTITTTITTTTTTTMREVCTAAVLRGGNLDTDGRNIPEPRAGGAVRSQGFQPWWRQASMA
jgi:hypothetical protein